jgi:hypothetical protein
MSSIEEVHNKSVAEITRFKLNKIAYLVATLVLAVVAAFTPLRWQLIPFIAAVLAWSGCVANWASNYAYKIGYSRALEYAHAVNKAKRTEGIQP